METYVPAWCCLQLLHFLLTHEAVMIYAGCLGVQVVMVPDEIDASSAEVRAAAHAFEIVITAGGVGPTRDDVTMAGVAEALGKPLSGCATRPVFFADLHSFCFWP